MTKGKMFGWGVCASLGIALLSLLMVYIDAGGEIGVGGVGITGWALINEGIVIPGGLRRVIAVGTTIIALIVALVKNVKKYSSFGVAPLVLSVISMVFMFWSFTILNLMDYVGIGFWMFLVAHAAAAVLSVKANNADE